MTDITIPATVAEAIDAWPHLFETHRYAPEIASAIDGLFEIAVRTAAPALGAVAVMGARLAVAHGHGCAGAAPGPWSVAWTILNGWPEQWNSLLSQHFPSIGPDSALSHITGTGRLRWEIRGGSLLITVSRPAGEVLRALVRTDGEVTAYADGRTPFHTYHVDTLEFAVATALGQRWGAPDEVTFAATPREEKVEEIFAAWESGEGPMFEEADAPGEVAEYAREEFRAVGNMYGYWVIQLAPSFEVSRSTLSLAGRALAAGYGQVEVLEAMRRWEASR